MSQDHHSTLMQTELIILQLFSNFLTVKNYFYKNSLLPYQCDLHQILYEAKDECYQQDTEVIIWYINHIER